MRLIVSSVQHWQTPLTCLLLLPVPHSDICRIQMKVYILYCDGFLISRCTAPRLCFSQYSTGDIFFPSVKSLLICCLIFLQKISIFQIFFFNLLWKECLQNLCPFKKSKMPWCPFEYFGVLLKDNREKIKIKYFQLLWVHKRLPIIAEFFNWQ